MRLDSKEYCYNCAACGKQMNIVKRMLGEVCGDCVKKKHKEATK
jgi:predicted nucleic acid-binding Zn ribbon protein